MQPTGLGLAGADYYGRDKRCITAWQAHQQSGEPEAQLLDVRLRLVRLSAFKGAHYCTRTTAAAPHTDADSP